jgi:hypothetical protein
MGVLGADREGTRQPDPGELGQLYNAKGCYTDVLFSLDSNKHVARIASRELKPIRSQPNKTSATQNSLWFPLAPPDMLGSIAVDFCES